MAISFVAAGTTWTRGTSGTGFTLNLPTVAVGDLLVALVSFYPGSNASLLSVTPPSGWTTKLNTISIDAASPAAGDRCQIVVMYRMATGSEGATATGTIGSSVTLITSGVVAYRGVQQIGNTVSYLADESASFSTGTVNNPSASNWRCLAAAYVSATQNYDITANEVSLRFRDGIDDEVTLNRGVQGAMWDSNAAVAAGNHSRTVSKSNTWAAAASYLMILEAQTGTPASGTWASTLGKVSAAGDGEVVDPATVAATLPAVGFTGDGFGQPPVASGTASAALPAASASVAAATDVLCVMSASVLPSMSFQGETRSFGVRVITVEADNRTILVESRGAAD